MPGRIKKKWGKPKLIVLTRGDSGERVLSACKYQTPFVGTPSESGFLCRTVTVCVACTDNAAS